MGELTEAIQTLQMAMSLPNVRRAASSAKSKHKKIELSPADCVSVFLELAEALWLNGEQASLTASYVRFFNSGPQVLTHVFDLVARSSESDAGCNQRVLGNA